MSLYIKSNTGVEKLTNIYQKVLLATYPSNPLNNLQETTLSFDLSEYDEVEIWFCFNWTAPLPNDNFNYKVIQTIPTNGFRVDVFCISNISNAATIVIASRIVYATSTGITFGVCNMKDVLHPTEAFQSNYLVPESIYGIKYQ